MKKTLSILFIGLALVLAGCSNSTNKTTTSNIDEKRIINPLQFI